MIRRALLGTGAIALVLGSTLATGGGIASAAPPPVQMSGTITCAVVGTLSFGANLTSGGATPATVQVKAKLKGCTGAGTTLDGVTVTKGSLSANSGATTMASNCGPVFAGGALPTLNGQIKWKATVGTAVTSTVSITSASAFYDVSGNTISVGLPTAVSAGSYAAQPVTFGGLGSNKSAYTTVSRCGAKGVKSFTFGKPSTIGSVTGTVTIAGGGS